MTRAVYRFVKWKLTPDLEPDAEPFGYAMECAVCEERSPVTGEFEPAQDWALRHGAREGDHHTYREISTRPWRAFPTEGLPS